MKSGKHCTRPASAALPRRMCPPQGTAADGCRARRAPRRIAQHDSAGTPQDVGRSRPVPQDAWPNAANSAAPGRARKSVLEDLESRQEALGIGVKEILSRARTARTPPWDRVLGSVTELLEVDLEQAALAEIALGRRAQAIVIDDLEPLIEYLNHATVPIAGRVGFVVRRGDPAANESRSERRRVRSADFSKVSSSIRRRCPT